MKFITDNEDIILCQKKNVAIHKIFFQGATSPFQKIPKISLNQQERFCCLLINNLIRFSSVFVLLKNLRGE